MRHAPKIPQGPGNRSRNGTFVNGRPVTVGYVVDGDVVRLGRVVFRFIEIGPQRHAGGPLRRIGLAVRGGHSIMTNAAA